MSRSKSGIRICYKCKKEPAYRWLSYCRPCFNAIRREKYQKKEMVSLRRRRRAAYIAMKSKPCTDCKNTFPWQVMEYDHVPGRGEKLGEVKSFTRSSMGKLRAEIAKCDLVCPTCHRIRTWMRQEAKRNKETS